MSLSTVARLRLPHDFLLASGLTTAEESNTSGNTGWQMG